MLGLRHPGINQVSEAVVGMTLLALSYATPVMLTNSKQWAISHSQQFEIEINGVKMSILTFASSLRRLWSTACLLCVDRALCAIQYMMETWTPVARLRAGRERRPSAAAALFSAVYLILYMCFDTFDSAQVCRRSRSE